MRRAIFNVGLAALLVSAVASGARADVKSEITFQGTLSTSILGDTSVSGQFDFDFTTDTVTSFTFTAPGASFDSSVFNGIVVIPFSSSGTSYFDFLFSSASSRSSSLALVVNPAITNFFTQSFGGGIQYNQSLYDCGSLSCGGCCALSFFASGTVSRSAVPEPSTLAMLLMGFHAARGTSRGWRPCPWSKNKGCTSSCSISTYRPAGADSAAVFFCRRAGGTWPPRKTVARCYR
jgi:hypothetical protein